MIICLVEAVSSLLLGCRSRQKKCPGERMQCESLGVSAVPAAQNMTRGGVDAATDAIKKYDASRKTKYKKKCCFCFYVQVREKGISKKQERMVIAMQMANMNTLLAAQNMTRGGVDAASAVSCISPAQPQAAQVAIPVADAIEKEDAATKLEKLANLKAQGILSEDEFKAAKKAILGNLSVVRPSAPAAC